jgi:type 2 lantibiotic biosynthesis protein LanM
MNDQSLMDVTAELNHPAWYDAVTLAERVAALGDGGASEAAELGAWDRDLANRRFLRWQSERAFAGNKERFARRLNAQGLVEDTLKRLLAEQGSSVRDRLPGHPVWLQDMVCAFVAPASAYTMVAPEAVLADSTDPRVLRASAATGFLLLVDPLIQKGRLRMAQGLTEILNEYPHALFDVPTAESLLFSHLPQRLGMLVGRTMVLELNVARLQGLLTGETPEQRFVSFLEQLRRPEISLALLKEYPVLARQVATCIDQWLQAGCEFARHLCEDLPVLQEMYCAGHALGNLTHLNWGMGDGHREGRAICIATFSSGVCLVYKPRSLAVDVHFQELLAWLNDRGDHPPFRLLKVLDKGSHGWVEFVPFSPCEDREAVRRFYMRQGGYLALLYALRATDFHYENLIACGEYPVLIDLESLFHGEREANPDKAPSSVAVKALESSVLRVGLLPQRIWGNSRNKAGVELSGFGGAAGQVTPFRVPAWEGIATDEMRLERKHVPVPGAQNRAKLHDLDTSALDYTDEILKGFSDVYRLLLDYRATLLAAEGPIARFIGDEVRYIVRATRLYATLLEESYHPDLLRNALDRDRYFDRLWIEVEARPSLENLIADEVSDLQRGDIPIFTTRVGSVDLWSSSGRRTPQHFVQSGLELARQRLALLSDADLAFQSWLIRSSMLTLAMGLGSSTQKLPTPLPVSAKSSVQADSARLVASARAIGDRLETLALIGPDEIGWIGLTLVNDSYWSVGTTGFDLYEGLPGIGLFLGYLGAHTSEARYTTLAERVYLTIKSRLQQTELWLAGASGGQMFPIGAFAELGGIMYFLMHMGVLWRKQDLLELAETVVQYLPPLIERDRLFDVMGGAAGCLAVLSALYRTRPTQNTLRCAVQCGEHLLANVQPMAQGAAWNNGIYGKQPLAGFSHGATGIAWALLQLYEFTGDQRYKAAAFDGFAYEHIAFSDKEGNWRDLRELDGVEAGLASEQASGSFMVAWCHGAPGVGLGRLDALKHAEDSQIDGEIRTALSTTVTDGFLANFSLCHGSLGNLELLLKASATYESESLREQTYLRASSILDAMDAAGWLCGVPLGVETPGLMLGLAGIGYQLLRLADPQTIPSVLLLEPPRPPETYHLSQDPVLDKEREQV